MKSYLQEGQEFQAIANNENTQKYSLQNLMQTNENEKSFLECRMLVMQKIFQLYNANKANASTKYVFGFFQCNRVNSTLNNMKNESSHQFKNANARVETKELKQLKRKQDKNSNQCHNLSNRRKTSKRIHTSNVSYAWSDRKQN